MKRLLGCIIVIFMLLACSGEECSELPTYVSGELTEDTVWSGDIEVTAPVTVATGITLTIEPGTRINFTGTDMSNSPSNCLEVNGTLISNGTNDAPVILYSSNNGFAGIVAWAYHAGSPVTLTMQYTEIYNTLSAIDIRGHDGDWNSLNLSYCKIGDQHRIADSALRIQRTCATITHCTFDGGTSVYNYGLIHAYDTRVSDTEDSVSFFDCDFVYDWKDYLTDIVGDGPMVYLSGTTLLSSPLFDQCLFQRYSHENGGRNAAFVYAEVAGGRLVDSVCKHRESVISLPDLSSVYDYTPDITVCPYLVNVDTFVR